MQWNLHEANLALVQDFLVIEQVSKSFGPVRAVNGVSLKVAAGEVFSLLGPSGCGKTTLLRMLAGFDRPDNGRILLKGQDITDLPPERRPVNTVFQNYALFPHLSVRDNIAFGLKMSKTPKPQIRAAVDQMLELVRLKEHADKRPGQLSGGQRQRVAIARALVNKPQVLLLDEPLAALDLKLRQHMLSELRNLHREVGATFIYVTHDQGEALSLSDRIAVLNEGRLEQVDQPGPLYRAPHSRFVASFIGDANFLDGTFIATAPGGHARIQIDGIGELATRHDTQHKPGANARLMVRPEDLTLSTELARENSISATIEDMDYLGSHRRVRIRCGEHRLHVLQQNGEVYPPGASVWVSFHPNCSTLLPPEA